VEVGTVENFETNTCSPFALSGAFSAAHSIDAGPWTAYAQGSGLSTAMREKTVIAQARTSALLPISDVVVTTGFVGNAGIRSWSPPV
jgi:hypothetical protein